VSGEPERMVKLHTNVMMCLPHSSTPKRPAVCAFHSAKGRRVLVDVITTRPEISPEYMRSLSSEMNKALMGELCDRIMCSGGGAEAGEEDMIVTRGGAPPANLHRRKSVHFGQNLTLW
jgi:hypothetical protein